MPSKCGMKMIINSQISTVQPTKSHNLFYKNYQLSNTEGVNVVVSMGTGESLMSIKQRWTSGLIVIYNTIDDLLGNSAEVWLFVVSKHM